ncbi:MAG TPA: FAD-dependent oxidoreductase [Hypericibacter adhaerens]|uniref:FAD-dependent oxidoreductase n=1 Tax=Hypericibacter adhaerens TaxID=2602016 RepID=UPI002CC1B798|nr:FAD-dependent oxidoreductase [Hypericibacter adhaerens]HWA45956.1 FAD-dependent oxidoreductase [Hypericibacter adhaerens]
MAQDQATPSGPDLTQGIPIADLADGKLVGRVGDQEVLLVRQGAEIFAVGARCTHYQGPLAEGLLVEGTVRCPWHHACFDLRTGEALRAPALSPLPCWSVERQGDRVFVRGQREAPAPSAPSGKLPKRIVIVGGGAAGFTAAEMLRRRGYGGGIVMVSGDSAAPVDRPNLSKDYLSGNAPEEWVPLRPDGFYAESKIELRLNTNVASIEPGKHEIVTEGGERIPYDKLLLATGADPVRLPIPGADLPHVHALRSLADSRAIIEAAKTARQAVVIGASFIGLEVAASLRTRGLAVHVVAPEPRPMERILGPQMGDFIRALHEEHGVVFHLQDTVTAIERGGVTLKSGGRLETDLVVAGVGVRPRLTLAEKAGLATDRGVTVNPYLETSAPDIYAAGDIARWPDPHSGEMIRVEHWVVALRQGQTAALNMLGHRERYAAVPFFWSQHYDVSINYVGRAETWDELLVEGDIAARDCMFLFKRAGRVLAAASIFRDLRSLQIELAMECGEPIGGAG